VYEDGVLQTIRSFTPPSGHTEPADAPVVASSADLAKIGNAPVVILVLDELDTRFEDMAYAREALKKYLQSSSPQLPQPTEMVVVDDKKFNVIHDYTQNRDALLATLEKHFPAYPYRMMKGGSAGVDASERMIRAVGSLMEVAEASTGIAGRKNVIWVGCGFPSLSTDMGSMNSKAADELNQTIRDATQGLLDARVTVNVIDPTMMASSTLDTSDPDIIGPQDIISATDESGRSLFPGDINFTDFAVATGGFAYSLRNDVQQEIESSIGNNSSYFTLSYSPTNHADTPGAFRKIRILMNRPGLVANTRTGYYAQAHLNPGEKPPIPASKRLAFDLTSAGLSKASYNGLSVKPTLVADGYTLQVPTNALSFWMRPDGIQGAEVTVMVVCFGQHDRVLAHLPLEFNADLPPPDAQEVEFKVPLKIPSGTVRIRFVVRDAVSGKMGTADVSP